MSTYQASDIDKDNDAGEKMSTIKENKTSSRNHHKRPDKQLYVPRALRKSGMKNVPDKVNSSAITKAPVKCFQATDKIPEMQKSKSDSSMQKEESDCVKNTKNFSSDVNSIPSVKQNGISLDQTFKKSALKKTANSVSKDTCDPTSVDCQKVENVLLNVDMKESSKTSEMLSSNTKDEINIKSVDKLTNSDENTEINNEIKSIDTLTSNVENTEISNEVLHNDSNRALCNPVTIVHVNVQNEISPENPGDSWETMFNDEGDCLDPKFIKELCDVTGEVNLTVAKNDYSNYQPVSKNSSEEFENIVELYGFPVDFSTQDLTSAFSSFQEASYNIKWVDDCHALVIFSSPAIASQALHLSHPLIKVRPVSEGIKESKEKARFCARMFENHKPRPVTSAVLARRLVSGALGLKVNASKEQRDIERNMLKEAKDIFSNSSEMRGKLSSVYGIC